MLALLGGGDASLSVCEIPSGLVDRHFSFTSFATLCLYGVAYSMGTLPTVQRRAVKHRSINFAL